MKKEKAVNLYAEGKVTLKRAAMDSAVPAREMMEYSRQRKIPMQYDMEDLRR